ncbi:MAG: hypothetical protein AAFQ67_09625, partial [Pseudomonadota bacterium]
MPAARPNTTLGIENRPNRSGNAGPEILTDGFGVVIEERDEDQRFNSDFTEATAALTWNRPNGDIGNFNGSFALFNFHTREASFRFPVDGVDNQRIFRRGEDEWNSEVSGDYQFGLGPGKLKLIGLYRAENSDFASETLEAFEDARPLDISRFNQDVFESEVIARAEYDISPRQGRDWQFSIEAARNVLDADSSFFLLDSNGVFVEELLDNADTRVEERRAETNVTYSRRLTPKLSLQSSIGVEYSELSQSGPTGQTRDFFRPKGFISAAWQGSPRFAVTARVEREVGQLNFFDFVSSVNLNIENEDEGNPDLVPSQTWAGEIEFERNFGDAGAATLRLYGDLIS